MHNLLTNGMGGIQWAGFELWVQVLGVSDVEGLMWRLETIVNHRAPEDRVQLSNDEED